MSRFEAHPGYFQGSSRFPPTRDPHFGCGVPFPGALRLYGSSKRHPSHLHSHLNSSRDGSRPAQPAWLTERGNGFHNRRSVRSLRVYRQTDSSAPTPRVRGHRRIIRHPAVLGLRRSECNSNSWAVASPLYIIQHATRNDIPAIEFAGMVMCLWGASLGMTK